MVRIEGKERLLEGDDADVIQRLNQLLVREDPDILLTDWGDSYLLPRLMATADRLRLPLALGTMMTDAGMRALEERAIAAGTTAEVLMEEAGEKIAGKVEAADAKIRAALTSARAEIEAVAAEAAQDMVSRLTGVAVDKKDAALAVKAEMHG